MMNIKTIRRASAWLFAVATMLSTTAFAHGYTSGTLSIAHPYALPTPPGATTGGAYLKEIDNKGAIADTLLSASSPIADRVELHNMQMDGNIMRMRDVKTIAIAPGASVAMAPGGGYHLMMIGIHQPFVVGKDIPLTLQFEHAGKVDVMLHVQERGAPMTMSMDHQHEMTK
jgi:copper(I)-binding protein